MYHDQLSSALTILVRICIFGVIIYFIIDIFSFFVNDIIDILHDFFHMKQIADIAAVSGVFHTVEFFHELCQGFAQAIGSANIVGSGVNAVRNADNVHKWLICCMLFQGIPPLFVVP